MRRSTAGNQAREGNDGKPDIVSVNENNELSSPPAPYASETQNHIDNTGDPPSDGEAGPGGTLSVHEAPSPVPSCITGARDVDEEDSEVRMTWPTLTSPNSATLPEWKESVKLATPRPLSKQQRRDYRAEVTASTTAEARDPQLTVSSVRRLLQRLQISHIPQAPPALPATRL